MSFHFKIVVFFLSISSLVSAQSSKFLNLDSLMSNLESSQKFMGNVILTENGKTIYARAVGKSDRENNIKSAMDTRYRTGTITNMYTACLVFKAIEEKKMALEWTLDHFFPTIKNSKNIIVSHLLNHHSGIHDFTIDSIYRTYYQKNKSQLEMIDIISKFPSDFEPGTNATFSNSNYLILSYILEKVYGKTFDQILEEKITKPLGLKHTYVGGKVDLYKNEAKSYSYLFDWTKDSTTHLSTQLGAGAIISSSEDEAKFIDYLFNDKILTKGSLITMKMMSNNFGNGLFLYPFNKVKGYGHTGGIDGFKSLAVYYPDSKMAIVVNSNGVNFDPLDLYLAAMSSYHSLPYTVPTFKTLDLKSSDLDKYLGLYNCVELNLDVTITKDKNRLIAQGKGQQAFPLDAIHKDVFEFIIGQLVLEFNPEEKKFTLKQGGKDYTFSKK